MFENWKLNISNFYCSCWPRLFTFCLFFLPLQRIAVICRFRRRLKSHYHWISWLWVCFACYLIIWRERRSLKNLVEWIITWNYEKRLEFSLLILVGLCYFLLVEKSLHHPVLVRCHLDLILRCVVVVNVWLIASESSRESFSQCSVSDWLLICSGGDVVSLFVLLLLS